MGVIVIGGHSRNIGKTSVVSSLISGMSEFPWTAIKVTQFGHGVCNSDGAPCSCGTAIDQCMSLSLESDPASGTDTSRYLAAGAKKSLWLRTRQGNLAATMMRLRREIAAAPNAIVESNSIMGFLCPDLYLVVLDPEKKEFRESAKLFLSRADAFLVLKRSSFSRLEWPDIAPEVFDRKPKFVVEQPSYVTPAILDFVRSRLTAKAA